MERDPTTGNIGTDPRTNIEGPERECPVHGYYNGDKCPDCEPKGIKIETKNDTNEGNN